MVDLFAPPLFLNFSNASFGSFQTATGSNTALFNLTGHTFTLYITETLPAPSGGSPATFNATLTGAFASTASGTTITFTNPSQNVTFPGGVVTYTIVPPAFLINPPSTLAGVTTIQGTIAAVPEPATMAAAVTGLGFVGGGNWLRRRRKAD